MDYQTGNIYKFKGNGTVDPRCAYYPDVTEETSSEVSSTESLKNLIAVYVTVPIFVVIIIGAVVFFVLLKAGKLPGT